MTLSSQRRSTPSASAATVVLYALKLSGLASKHYLALRSGRKHGTGEPAAWCRLRRTMRAEREQDSQRALIHDVMEITNSAPAAAAILFLTHCGYLPMRATRHPGPAGRAAAAPPTARQRWPLPFHRIVVRWGTVRSLCAFGRTNRGRCPATNCSRSYREAVIQGT
jgi:hypothetical protein